METTNWQVVKKVIEFGNITEASEELNISQSGISYIIKKVENETGFPLFIRHKKGMTLTSNAKELLPFIDELLLSEDKLIDACTKITSQAKGRLVIGSYKSIATNWLPQIIEEFQKKYPKIKIEIRQGSSDFIEKSLQNNSIDFAFTSNRKRYDFDWIELKSDLLLGVIPTNHPYAHKHALPLTLFEDEQFIGIAEDYEYDINRILKLNGIMTNKSSLSVNDEDTLLQMVKQGFGIILLFDSYLNGRVPDGLVLKRTIPTMYRQLGIAIKHEKNSSTIIKHFIKISKELLCQELMTTKK